MSTIDERIATQEERLKREKAKLQKLEAKKKEKERSERTHRLIEFGAVMEKLFGSENNTPEFRQAFISYLTKERTGKDGTTFTNVQRVLTGTLSEMKLLSENPQK